MNSEELKSIQAPLKELYRDNPESALVTLKSEGRPTKGLSCKIGTGKAISEAGLHPATGGDGSQLCSGDMLLDALVACAGVTFSAVSTAMSLKVEDARILAEGDLDFRGTLGVDKTVPVGFKEIRMTFLISSVESEETLNKLLQLTERYCVIYQTIKAGVTISISRKEL
ncbi:MAG: OsmC family protein [Lentisphaeria bacterium]|nr:OsmC family protein [Lentisphaeria bacterium]NQZ69616.1 OsmC family protein [Lentisphaeria bacterium]